MDAPRIGLLLSTMVLVVAGCAQRPEGPSETTKLVVYEGLPHQLYEAEKLAAEKASRPTTELHGFPFYRETLGLKPADEAALRKILGDRNTYGPYAGEKKCGGFHPDYAVGWASNDEDYLTLICFGCGDLRVFGPNGATNYDMPQNVRQPLRDLLTSYRKNRPPFDGVGP